MSTNANCCRTFSKLGHRGEYFFQERKSDIWTESRGYHLERGRWGRAEKGFNETFPMWQIMMSFLPAIWEWQSCSLSLIVWRDSHEGSTFVLLVGTDEKVSGRSTSYFLLFLILVVHVCWLVPLQFVNHNDQRARTATNTCTTEALFVSTCCGINYLSGIKILIILTKKQDRGLKPHENPSTRQLKKSLGEV